METAIVNAPEIEKVFDRLRKAGHGSIIKFDATESGQPIEGIIFEPTAKRPNGFGTGVFVMVPSDPEHVYYFDPESSRDQGRLIIRVLDAKKKSEPPPTDIEGLIKDFEHLRKASDVYRGGGATGESCSKAKGIIEI